MSLLALLLSETLIKLIGKGFQIFFWFATSRYNKTHQSGSTIDLIFTNLTDFYYAPSSLGPLLNSDNFIILWEANSAIPKPQRVKYTVRPLSEDSISTFGRWIGNYQFEDICSEQDINIKVNKLNTLLQEQFHTCFPVKVITVSDTN